MARFIKKMENINYKSVLKDKEKMNKIEVKQSDFDKILVKIANKNKCLLVFNFVVR